MALATAVNVKQLVLTQGTFGPQEIQQIVEGLADDPANHRSLREAVNELEVSEDRSPAAAVRLGRLPVSPRPLQSNARNAQERRRRGPGPFLSGQSLRGPGAIRQGPGKFRRGSQGRLRRRRLLPWPAPRSLRATGDFQGALEQLDRLHGAVEQTAEYLYQRGMTVAALHGSPAEVIALFERAVEADRKHSGACSAWRWKTIATATTTRPWISTSARSPAFRPTSARC